MDSKLEFVNVLGGKEEKYHRLQDLGAFEFTYKSEITSIHKLTQAENLYRVQILDPEERKHFSFEPGQFIMLELPGIGEAPFSISSSPSRRGDMELCIRKVGNLTNFLSKAERGTRIGLRGPFGTSFPMEKMQGQNILLIAGGLGLAPLRAPIAYVQEHRSHFKSVDIIYGTKDPSQLLFTYQYDMWRADDITLSIIVDTPDAEWKGPVGLITKVLQEMFKERNDTFFKNTYAIVCGPPVMFKFVCTYAEPEGHPHAEDVRLTGAQDALRHGKMLQVQCRIDLYVPQRPCI